MKDKDELIGKLVYVDCGDEHEAFWKPGMVEKEMYPGKGIYKIFWFDSDGWSEWPRSSVERGYFSRHPDRKFSANSSVG